VVHLGTYMRIPSIPNTKMLPGYGGWKTGLSEWKVDGCPRRLHWQLHGKTH